MMRRLGLSFFLLLAASAASAQFNGCRSGFCSSGVVVPFVPPAGLVQPFMADNLNTAMSSGTTQYIGIAGGGWTSGAASRDLPVYEAGCLYNLTVRLPTAMASGQYLISAAKNGSVPGVSPLQCAGTVGNSGQCTDTTNFVCFAAGDRASFQSLPSGSATAQTGQVQISAKWVSFNSNGMIGIPYQASPSNTVTNYTPVGNAGTNWSTTENLASGYMPIAGTLNGISIATGLAPGSGITDTYTIWINGVSQPSTACTLAGTTQLLNNCSWTPISFAIGDLVSLESVVTGGTSAAVTFRATVSYTPTVAGDVPVINVATSVSGGGTRNLRVHGTSGANATEATVLSIAPYTFNARDLYVTTAPAVSGANTRTLNYRKSTGTPGTQSNSTLAINLTGGATSASLLGTIVATTAGDTINLQSVPTGASTTTSFKSSFRITP